MRKNKKWSYELLHKTALMYETRGEFYRGSPNAYHASKRHGIFDDVCSHMENRTYWTDEKLFTEARKYNTRKKFQRGSPNAYEACRYHKILDDVCSHMEKLPHWDKPHCVYLIEIFTTNNELYYYVGQTSDLKNRLYMHFHYKVSDSPVFDFLNKNSIEYKKHHIVKDNLSYEESLELEKNTIKDLKDRGVKLLNKDLYNDIEQKGV